MKPRWDPTRLVAEDGDSRWFALVVLVAYAAIVAVVAWHHEPWRDEADQWLFVRDCDVPTMLARTRYGGFPSLWYLCLVPLVKSGLPYMSQAVLHVAVAVAAMGVMLLKAPFTRLTRLLIAGSYFFSYEYSVVVRCYALAVLLIFAAAALFSTRRERPLLYAIVLGLLANVTVQGFLIAGALGLELVIDRWSARALRGRALAATAILAIGGFVAWLQMRRPPDAAIQAFRGFNVVAFPWVISNAFLPSLPMWMGFPIAVAILVLTTLAVRRRSSPALLVLWLPMAALTFIHVFVWLGGIRHAGFFLLFTLVAIWTGAAADDRSRAATGAALLLNTTLLISCLIAAGVWADEIRDSYSGAEEMAGFIRAHDLQRFDIAAHNLTQCAAVLPYFPGKKLWYAGREEYGSYMTWDQPYEAALDVPYPVAERRAVEHFAGRPYLLLFNVEMPDPPAHGFRLLYATHRPMFRNPDEHFWLYEPVSLGQRPASKAEAGGNR